MEMLLHLLPSELGACRRLLPSSDDAAEVMQAAGGGTSFRTIQSICCQLVDRSAGRYRPK
jgi:hypothetical protein